MPDTQAEVHMAANYAKLLEGIDLGVVANLNVLTPAENEGSIATQISTNTADMMEYE